MGMRSASSIMRRSARRTRSRLARCGERRRGLGGTIVLLDACILEANKVIHRDVKASNILVEPSQKD